MCSLSAKALSSTTSRFTRELQNLKKMADYSSRDTGNLNTFLQAIGAEFSIYTYSMLNAGVDKDSIRNLSEDQLTNECGISNSIHRLRILDSIKSKCVRCHVNCVYTAPVFFFQALNFLVESFGLLNDLFPLPSILDTGYPVF